MLFQVIFMVRKRQGTAKSGYYQVAQQSGASFVLLTHLSDEKKHTDTVNPHGLILGGAMYGNSLEGYLVLCRGSNPGAGLYLDQN
jgi:hypothetical protein